MQPMRLTQSWQAPLQTSLFAMGAPELSSLDAAKRTVLDGGSWYDHVSGWIKGADELFFRLRDRLAWREQSRQMYERTVAIPRLLSVLDGDALQCEPLLQTIGQTLSEFYETNLHLGLAAYYRDGSDSVAWHADRFPAGSTEGTTSIVSLGGPRRLLIRAKGGSASQAVTLASGDLLVLGGTIHQLYEHCVPKCQHALPRISLLSFAGERQEPPAT